MNLKDLKNKKILLYIGPSILVGLVFGYLVFGLGNQTKYVFSGSEDSGCISGLTLIKPSINCEISDQKLTQLSILKDKLEVLIDLYKKAGTVDRVGVFVRDIRSTRFVGINENEEFIMASLLKAPVLIGVLKLAEVQPKILGQEILYDGSINEYKDQNYSSGEKLTVGKKYTLLELATRSIEYSDNTATRLVSNYFAPGYLSLISEAYGIKAKNINQEEDYVSPRVYANIFRSLYNASYLTSEYSNQALSILTKVKFNQGAVAKLPKDVIVAHKFAERSGIKTSAGEVKQLHDCGLVYAKDGHEPYTFCIMTEGKEFEELEKAIQEISLEIYDVMANQQKE